MNPPQLAASWFDLTGRAVHVWPICIHQPGTDIKFFENLLSPDELERARRFRFEHLRRDYTFARSALRILLGCYLQRAAEQIQFSYGAHGKPALASNTNVCFNLSHSGRLAVLAFSLNCELGIDIEQIHPIQDMEDLAARFFCPEETAELSRVPEAERNDAFFRCWTLKEAYIKATGKGLSVSLNDFRIAFQPDKIGVVHISQDRRAADQWTLHSLDLVPSYAVSIAYRDSIRPLYVRPFLFAADLLSIASMHKKCECKIRSRDDRDTACEPFKRSQDSEAQNLAKVELGIK